MSTPDNERCARRASTSRKVAALTAIIQTLLPEVFCKVGEEPDERLFVEMVTQGDPVSMAIANELTPEEIAAAFGWRDQPNGTMETEIRAMPVMVVLGEEQREGARVMCVAEEAADRIYALAHENKGTATGEGGAMMHVINPQIHGQSEGDIRSIAACATRGRTGPPNARGIHTATWSEPQGHRTEDPLGQDRTIPQRDGARLYEHRSRSRVEHHRKRPAPTRSSN